MRVLSRRRWISWEMISVGHRKKTKITFSLWEEVCSAPATCDLLPWLCAPLLRQPDHRETLENRKSKLHYSLNNLKSFSSTLVSAAATRSMAPPIPFTILPGIIQLARSPQRDTLYQFLDSEEIVKCPQTRKFLRTCIAPKMVRPTWPPLIMAKLSSLEKKELPGMAVTVCLPALIRSGSTFGLHDWKLSFIIHTIFTTEWAAKFYLVRCGEGAKTEDPIFWLQVDGHSGGDEVGSQHRHSNPKVGVPESFF